IANSVTWVKKQVDAGTNFPANHWIIKGNVSRLVNGAKVTVLVQRVDNNCNPVGPIYENQYAPSTPNSTSGDYYVAVGYYNGNGSNCVNRGLIIKTVYDKLGVNASSAQTDAPTLVAP
ncbi:MAG: hypothetical protein KDD25_10265, partial [Bdellovibrionales bacterium]|nr:hypothetical protein [Bdellovibrionales bacterium]